MITIPLGGPPRWFGVSHRFATAAEAKQAFERLHGFDTTGNMSIGVFRHLAADASGDPVFVSVVSRSRKSIEKSAAILDGEEVEQDTWLWIQMINRRIKVMDELADMGSPSGRYRVKEGKLVRESEE